MDTLDIEKINEVYTRINADPGVKMELYEYFSFFVDGYRYNPKFKAGIWDGKIRDRKSVV